MYLLPALYNVYDNEEITYEMASHIPDAVLQNRKVYDTTIKCS